MAETRFQNLSPDDRRDALEVAERSGSHKAMFFTENDTRGVRIDYGAAISGHLQLVPEGAGFAVLSDDYTRMLADGMLLDDNESFDMLMERCALLEVRANETKV